MSTVVAKNIAVQNSAGTASANISFDGTKLVGSAPFNGLGVGQTWQDVIASRALGVTYTNSTGKPIVVMARSAITTAGDLALFVNGVLVDACSFAVDEINTEYGAVVGIVPSGATYSVTPYGGTWTLEQWSELR